MAAAPNSNHPVPSARGGIPIPCTAELRRLDLDEGADAGDGACRLSGLTGDAEHIL